MRHGVVQLWAVLLALPFVFVACGPSEIEITPATLDGDRLLFERGQESLDQGDWLQARDYFSQVRDNYPQSSYRAEARLGIADSYEGQGTSEAYVSGLAEYLDFLALFPTHTRAAYAQYKIALIHSHQIRGPERDQSETRAAIREFELFIQSYPTSDLIGDVRRGLREARDRLSESEYYVGRYYYRRKWWPGAIDRLRAVIASDPEYTGREEVYFRLADALYQSGDSESMEEALTWFSRLLEEFPESLHALEVNEAVAAIEAELAAAPLPTGSDAPSDDDADGQ
jgi:outer membrane protein assembly factor BamD